MCEPELSHPVARFVDRATKKMAVDYADIRREHADDSNVAGYTGEGIWEQLLQRWLPPQVKFAKRVRILGTASDRAPEADLVVIDPRYPDALLDQQEILSSAVVAAIECKSTYNSTYLKELPNRAEKTKSVSVPGAGTMQRRAEMDINGGFPYFVVAFTAVWSDPTEHLYCAMQHELQIAEHPRNLADGIFIADHGWYETHLLPVKAHLAPYLDANNKVIIENGKPRTYQVPDEVRGFVTRSTKAPIANFIRIINEHLLKRDLASAEIQAYFSTVTGSGGEGAGRRWPMEIFSEQTRSWLKQ